MCYADDCHSRYTFTMYSKHIINHQQTCHWSFSISLLSTDPFSANTKRFSLMCLTCYKDYSNPLLNLQGPRHRDHDGLRWARAYCNWTSHEIATKRITQHPIDVKAHWVFSSIIKYHLDKIKHTSIIISCFYLVCEIGID